MAVPSPGPVADFIGGCGELIGQSCDDVSPAGTITGKRLSGTAPRLAIVSLRPGDPR